MKNLDFNALVEIVFLAAGATIAILFIGFTITESDPQDFAVYYYSAQTALQGGMIYTTYGPIHLPYWYFPWLAWFYVPLAFFTIETAYDLYVILSLLCALLSIYFLAAKMAPETNLAQRIFAWCMSLLLCWLLFRVGQMDFILLALAVLTIYFIASHRSYLAGLLIPILLFKPHLFLLFFPSLVLKGGKKLFVSATLATLSLAGISFIVIPDWPSRMIQLLSVSGQRMDNNWNFTTLPTLLGSQENWSGTANLPFTVALIILGLGALWTIRPLDTFPFLSLALAGSLFCAPRAYAYNFPMLIPALIWLSAGRQRSIYLVFWSVAGTASFFFRYSTGSYLIVLVVFVAGIIIARMQQRGSHSTDIITS